jgi:predicted nuclease of predicted toxin-antitoxin system
MKIRFLLDENLPPRIEDVLRDLDAQIDVIRVGDPGTPTLGTLDPDILTYLESSQRVLVTGNRRSIPKHLAAHMAAGRHHFGIA